MKRLPRQLSYLAVVPILVSCADSRTTSPKTASPTLSAIDRLRTASLELPQVRISEFHYDNVGTDVGERVEVSFPNGTDLGLYTLLLYNGNGGGLKGGAATSAANTIPLGNGAVTATSCGANRSVVVLSFPQDGIENGAPDGMALMGPTGVVDSLSYEGSFTTTNGPASGKFLPDIGVSEATPSAIGSSLWRNPDGTWQSAGPNTFGTCNDGTGDVTPPAPEVDSVGVTPATVSLVQGARQQFAAAAFDAARAPIVGTMFSWSSSDALIASVDGDGLVTSFKPGDVTITATSPNSKSGAASLHVDPIPDVRFSEIHYDNAGALDVNERIEIEGPGGTDLTGWQIVLYNGNGGVVYSARTLEGAIEAQCDGRGTTYVIYPDNTVQNGSPDGFALVTPEGQVAEFLSYEGTFTAADGPAAGRASIDIGKEEGGTTLTTQSLQRTKDGNAWQGPKTATFGDCNTDDVVLSPRFISFAGRFPSAPPLPVGFEDQLFAAELKADTRDTIDKVVVWTTETPDLATIDRNGVIHAYQVGTATFRATAADKTTATWTLPIGDPQPSTTAVWGGNVEFGEPVGANDVIIRRDQFTSSFSLSRNIPNWVSAKLEATHFGPGVDRCDCFTYDPLLPSDYPRYTTADYTGAGAFAGYLIDRGHLLRSADVTASDGDNKFTYLFSNIIPQSHDMNTGAWSELEFYLGNRARADKDVYIIAGASGSKGTVKGEGRITIPASVWKVAVIMPRGKGVADVRSAADLEVVAVIMPNDPQTNADWTTYKTTVDAVEALSGYDLLALLQDHIENQVESGSRPPVAAMDGPYAAFEGSSISMSAAGSSDPDGDAITGYEWNFGDGTTGSGTSVTHTYAQDGTYTVALSVTESHGIIGTATATATIGNVAPQVSDFAGARLLPGQMYSSAGAFSDPGADTWSATVDYGDGSGPAQLALAGMTFFLSHQYATPGIFTVTVVVHDGQATTMRSQQVTVLAPPVATILGPTTSTEGAVVEFSAVGSSDADGSIASYQWTLGDGASGITESVSHTFAQDGSYPVTLTVTDNDGLTDARTFVIQVSNVAPVIMGMADATLLRGETYAASASFTDPGADVWSAAADYGDGVTSPLALQGKSFSVSHLYSAAGSFTLTVRLADDDVTSTPTVTIAVLTLQQALQTVLEQCGTITLRADIEAALKHLNKGQTNPTVNKLNDFLTDLDAAVRSGQVTAAQAEPLHGLVQRVIAAMK